MCAVCCVGTETLSFHSLIFLFYQGKTSNLPRIFSHCQTHKILGKDRENTNLTKEIPCLKLTKEIVKNQGKEGQGKDHDSQRRDRSLRFCLRPEIGQFSPHCYIINCTESLEKKEKRTPLEKEKKVETTPEVADFCPLSRSNERVLSLRYI